MLPQDVKKATLGERLVALGGCIHHGVTATGIQQTSAGVRVALATDAGESVVNARYVMGGDGLHSIVRTAAGIDFEGESYADSFVLADVEMEWSLGKTEVSQAIRNIILSVVNRISQARGQLSMSIFGLSRKALAMIPQE